MKFPTLYNIDEKGKVRVWYMEVEGNKYRTVAGIEDGKLVESAWTVAEEKNVGRSNFTDGEAQALSEVNAKYKKKKEQKYSEVKEEASRSNILQPMLAVSWKDIKDKEALFKQGIFSQPKLDGIRCLVSKDDMMSRTGKPIVSCPHVQEALGEFFDLYPDVVLDGELYHHDLRDNFNEISSLITKKKPTSEHILKTELNVQYHVYDVIGRDDTFFVRNHVVSNSGFGLPIVVVPSIRVIDSVHLDDIYGDYLANGYEGQMIRVTGSLYEHKRSKNLIKRKEFMDEEFRVVEIVEGKGNWSGYAKSVVCYDPIQDLQFSAGIKGSQDFTRDLLKRTPKTVTVRFPNKTPDGIPRFPVAVAWYDEERDI